MSNKKDEKDKKRAEVLRQNLLKRKEQARKKATTPQPVDAEDKEKK